MPQKHFNKFIEDKEDEQWIVGKKIYKNITLKYYEVTKLLQKLKFKMYQVFFLIIHCT
jgi:hypothetical protein